MKNRVRAILGGASAAALIGAGALFAAPAQAAGLGEPLGAGPEDVTITKIVTDAGGQDFEVKETWGHTYKDNSGNIRVTLYGFHVNAIGINADDEGIDARVRVYSGRPDGTTVKIQDKIWDGADDPIDANLRNPLNYPNITKIIVSRVGIDGDGLAGAPSFTVKQPVIGDNVTP